MKKGILAAIGALLWLGLTYLIVVYLLDKKISKNCYIQTREIVYIHEPWALEDPSPIYGQANFVQRKLNDSKLEFGSISDSIINEILNNEYLYHCVLLKADSSYYEVLCMSSSDRGIGSYVVTPDTIYSITYRPIVIVKKTRPN